LQKCVIFYFLTDIFLVSPLENTKEDCKEIFLKNLFSCHSHSQGDPFDIIKDGREPAKNKILEKKNENVE
jgi:hypothetical protein